MLIDLIKAKGEELKILEGTDRLQYLVDLARQVEPLDEKFKTEENKIRGCVSNLWLTGKVSPDGKMKYKHDADSYITKGTAKLLIDLCDGQDKNEVSKLVLGDFKWLGIRELLTPQRQIGFAGLIERIINYAR